MKVRIILICEILILQKKFFIPSVVEDRDDCLFEGEMVSHQGGEIPVYQNGDRKVVYIDEANWSTAVVLPAESKIDIYTDKAKNCSPLIMQLDKNGEPHILLSHILFKDSLKQIENIKQTLIQEGFKASEIIFSPRHDSPNVDESVGLLKSFEPQNFNVARRNRRESASALVTDDGFIMTSGMKKNRKTMLSLWNEE